MIKSQKELKRAIYDAKQTLTEEEIFGTRYEEMLTDEANSIADTKALCTKFVNADFVAATDGNNSYISRNSQIVTKEMSIKEKNSLYRTLNFHEAGHKLFTDFRLGEEILRNFEKDGKIYPALPEETEYLDDLYKYLNEKGSAKLVGIYRHLDNSIEDGFVDRANIRLFPGYAKCMRLLYERDKECLGISENFYQEHKAKGDKSVSIFLNLCLIYARHGLKGFKEEDENDDLIISFKKIMPYIEKAVYENSSILRAKEVWRVFCQIFHFIDESSNEAKNNENSSSNDESGNSSNENKSSSNSSENEKEGSDSSENENTNSENSDDNSSDETGTSTEDDNSSGETGNSTEAGNSSGETGTSTGAGTPSTADDIEKSLEDVSDSLINTEQSSHSSNSEASRSEREKAQKMLEKATKEASSKKKENTMNSSAFDDSEEKLKEMVATDKVRKQQEEEIGKKFQMEGNQVNDVPIHKGIHANTTRQAITYQGESLYNSEKKELDLIVSATVKRFKKEITERQLGDTINGQWYGKRMSSKDLYRKDKRFFSQKKLPEDIPDMAVGILVDLSGSMGGDKIEYARKSAYVTYRFCRELNIPCFLIGHTTEGNNVRLHLVCDENEISEKDDEKRIFSMTAMNSNRDGYALRVTLNRLDKMEATDKIAIVISDGQPAHQGYGFLQGKYDCQAAVADAVKKGITTIAAAVDDADGVKSVYLEDANTKKSAKFLDLTDLEKMPRAFVKILKEKLA